MDEGFTGLSQRFVVFAETTVAPKPGKGPLDDPATREDDEAAFSRALDDSEEPTAECLDPLDQLPGIASIRPDQLEPRAASKQLLQHELGAVSILEVSRVDDDRDQQAHGINGHVALAAGYFLTGVVAARPPFSVVLTLWLSMIAALGVAKRPVQVSSPAGETYSTRSARADETRPIRASSGHVRQLMFTVPRARHRARSGPALAFGGSGLGARRAGLPAAPSTSLPGQTILCGHRAVAWPLAGRKRLGRVETP